MNQNSEIQLRKKLKRQNSTLFWIAGIIALVVIAGSVTLTLLKLIDAAATISSAIIGAAAVIYVEIFSNNKAKIIELQSHQNRLAEQRDLEIQKQKQNNYNLLLEKIASYIRDGKSNNDSLSLIRLYSWIYGSEDVIKYTDEFMKSKNKVSLEQLLVAMRKDVGLKISNPDSLSISGEIFAQQESGFLGDNEQNENK